MPEMSASAFNRRATILRPIEAEDGGGGRERSGWQEVATRWAAARPTGGREALVAGVLANSEGWQVTLRFPCDVTVRDRLRLKNGPTLAIHSVADTTGRRRELLLLCESVQVP